jgi:hypothetical protein
MYWWFVDWTRRSLLSATHQPSLLQSRTLRNPVVGQWQRRGPAAISIGPPRTEGVKYVTMAQEKLRPRPPVKSDRIVQTPVLVMQHVLQLLCWDTATERIEGTVQEIVHGQGHHNVIRCFARRGRR